MYRRIVVLPVFVACDLSRMSGRTVFTAAIGTHERSGTKKEYRVAG